MVPPPQVFFGGFLLHVLLLAAVFEIYFKTPIVPGIRSSENPVPGPAQRLVFIVADGLRADSFYRNDKRSTPYLRGKLENHASWGVSHTRVPTESRPGVVALAAGIYEDPSAVFKGWKENPVEFDTLFNQSRHTWAWGSPDIVHMFRQANVQTYSYTPEEEDFSGKNASWALDEWVFNRVKSFFKKAKADKRMNKDLHQNKLVFFLHLLGLDTAGHTVRPQSKNYQRNLLVVDKGIQNIEELFESFFEDGRTAYVFTADHGMTDWGSHGAGSHEETEVPLVAWGAGVKGPHPSDPSDPESPRIWQLSHLKRKDVKQADIVVLLASLLGCSIPVNSVGRLPRSYLDLSAESIANLTLLNAKQILAQAERKRDIIRSHSLSVLYYPFSKLTEEDGGIKTKLIEQLIVAQKFDSAIQLCEELMDISLQALQYYYQYYQGPLLAFTSLAFLGWITWLFCQLNNTGGVLLYQSGKYTDSIFITLAVTIFLLIQVQRLGWQFNIFCLLPVFIWWSVFSMRELWLEILWTKELFTKFCVAAVLLILFTEIMIASFFQRWVLSVGVLISSLWPLFGTDKDGKEKIRLISPQMLMLWLLSCACVAIFPLMPVIGSESNVALVVFSGLLWIFVLVASISIVNNEPGWTKVVHEVIPLATAILVNYYVTWSMDLGNGLPIFCQFLSWNLLFSSIFACMFGELSIPKRITKMYTTIISPYMLLCVRHEGFFILALGFHLNCWLVLEAKLNGVSTFQLQRTDFPSPAVRDNVSRSLNFDDFRRAALYVFYMFLSFFGTGNIASINSFELSWVRCFVSVFSPFTMTFLILIKILIPFIIVTSTFRAINVTIKAPTFLMFIAVLIMCDMMGLQFLFLVTNEGSWLDIGVSISHYVIVQFTVMAVVVLYAISSVLTGVSLMNFYLELMGIMRGETVRRQMTAHFRT